MVETVQIQSAETGPVAPEESTTEEAQPTRPEWLPEKFNGPEDLANAYRELEAQNTKQHQETVQETQAPEDIDQVETPVPEGQNQEQAGLNFDQMAAEYRQNNQLSEERYQQLQEAGIPREVVEQYISGQQAVGTQLKSDAESIAGGEEQYTDMVNWATQNLSEGEQDQYNQAMASGNRDAILMAVRGLHSRYQSDYGVEPTLRHGSSQHEVGDTYDSWAQVSRDMASNEYKADPAYRAAVEQKLERSGPLSY